MYCCCDHNGQWFEASDNLARALDRGLRPDLPAIVRLTAKETAAMAAIHLGGIEATRTDTLHVHCRTIDSLCRKGLLAGSGLTAAGRAVAKLCADAEHAAIFA